MNGLLSIKEAATYCQNLPVNLLSQPVWLGTGPAFVRVSEKRIFFRIADLEAWMEPGNTLRLKKKDAGHEYLDPAIWAPVPIAPMPMLAYLRVCVLSRSAKRMPKWKFRVSPDIVTEVQRRSSSFAAAFHCKAVLA